MIIVLALYDLIGEEESLLLDDSCVLSGNKGFVE
jgi:hypothetical protein